jgi:thioredoxin-related protein
MQQLNVLIIISLFAYKLSYSETIDTCKITLHSDSLKNNQVKLGYYYGSKTFLKEIIQINNSGKGTYQNKLHKGIYFIVLPDSSICEIMIDDGKEIQVDINLNKDLINCTAKGNLVTEAYDTYQKKITEILEKADSARKVNSNSSFKIIDNNSSKLTKEQKTEIINQQKYSAGLYPGSLLQSYLNALIPFEISAIKKLYPHDSIGMLQTLYLYRNHYLDNINLNDERLIYTPIFLEKINSYLDKIISQQPDTIVNEIEKIYSSIENTEVRRFFLESQFNRYKQLSIKANQEYIYYKIIEKIYLSGLTPWEDEKRISQLKIDLERIKPVLLYQTAPEINLPGISNQDNSMSAMQSDYTLIIFWNFDCPLCSRIIKDINKTVSSYNYLSIRVYAVCINNDFEKWSSLSLKTIPQSWTNTIQLNASGPSVVYNISNTPTLYFLDSNKKIIQKNITNAELDKILLKIASGISLN